MYGRRQRFLIGALIGASALIITALNLALFGGSALTGLYSFIAVSSVLAAGIGAWRLINRAPAPAPTPDDDFEDEEIEVPHRSFLDTTLEGYWQIGRDGRTVEVNRALCRMLGYGEEEILGRPPADFAEGRDADILTAYLNDNGADAGIVEVVLKPKTGEPLHARFSASPLSGSMGEIGGSFALVSDMTDNKRNEFELRYLSQAVEQSPAAVIITDPGGNIQYVNEKFTEMTGYAREEVIGEHTGVLESEGSTSLEPSDLWDTIRAGNVWRGERHDKKKNGELYWMESVITPIRDENGSITHFLAIQEDITLRKQYEEQLVQQANYDKLTGLPNRLLGAERLTKALQKSNRRGTNAALLFIDLDGFKKINDSLGHSTGDRLLQDTATRLTESIRAADTVARWGGDEFLVVLPDLPTSESAELVAQKLIEVCSSPYELDGYELTVTASIGITVCPLDGTNATELMRNADAAMYAAKESGRNTYRFFTRELNESAVERLGLESDLRRALTNHEFALHFQPVVNLDSNEIIGAEALLRWNHPEKGMIPPDKFIPIAEETGLIVPLGDWVLRTACGQARQWRDEGRRDLTMAVNVSSRQIASGGFVESVARVIKETEIDPASLELEITERMLMAEERSTDVVIDELNTLGVGLSIDDFGTGYSSLSYLQRYPFDVLKIDRAFIDGVVVDPETAALARAIIVMAQSLDLKVIAEGVEGPDQLEFLREHGCDLAQGYHFSRPLEAMAFEALLDHGGVLPLESVPGKGPAKGEPAGVDRDTADVPGD
jgi:diguanylate cyclase (GGDEF)-like protein/PAS domain S-box-containing protein